MYTQAQYNERYNEGYTAGLQYAKENFAVTIYVLAAKESTTGIDEGQSITFNYGDIVSNRTWNNAIGKVFCQIDSDYSSYIWVTDWK